MRLVRLAYCTPDITVARYIVGDDYTIPEKVREATAQAGMHLEVSPVVCLGSPDSLLDEIYDVLDMHDTEEASQEEIKEMSTV
jgi:hypothetical protein